MRKILRWFVALVVSEVAEFFFVDTTPFVDKYFTEPGDHVYDWRGILPRKKYISNLLKVLNPLNQNESWENKYKTQYFLYY